MASLDPEAADCAADMAGANNADFHLGTRGRLSGCGRRPQRPLQDKRSCSAQERATTPIDGEMVGHQHTGRRLQDLSDFSDLCRLQYIQRSSQRGKRHKLRPGAGARTELI